ncbi:MAG: hypothetical protein ACOC0Z_06545, partial [Halohasta sp.]
MRRHAVVLSIVVLVVVGSAGLPVAAAMPAADTPSAATQPSTVSAQSTDDAVRLTTTLDRSPERSGEITATVSFRFPDRVTELTARLPEGATVDDTDGFSADTERDYEWDEQTDEPSVTFRVDADRLTDEEGPLAEDGRYLFADTDDWALVRIPSTGVRWTQTGSDELSVDRETRVDGSGVAGDRMAFLGDHEVETHSAHGQTFRLVVPEAADLEESPDEIFESLSHASDTLRVGDRDDEVLIIAAPTDGVDWGVRGLQTGDSELWVQDTERLDTPTNVWVHEYVHTRQRFSAETTDETRWLTEGSATYYAALLSLEDNRIDFESFQRALEGRTTDAQADSTLSDPDSWRDNANYGKGSLVVGELDRQIRLSTDSEASFQTVFRALNEEDDSLSATDFEASVAEASTDEVGAAARKYTTTDATPEMWSSQQHTEAFGQQSARFDFSLADDEPISVSGPDRNESISGSTATLSVGETLTVRMVVENVGGTVGSYELPFAVDDETTTETGRLDPGETSRHEFAHTFSEPGNYTVSVGDERLDIRVEDPEPESAATDSETDPGTDSDSAAGDSEPDADNESSSDDPIDVDTPGFGPLTAVSAL